MIISDAEISTLLLALEAHVLCCSGVVFWINLAEKKKKVPLQFFLLYVPLICWERNVLVLSLRNQATGVELHLSMFNTGQTSPSGGILVMTRAECHQLSDLIIKMWKLTHLIQPLILLWSFWFCLIWSLMTLDKFYH